MARPFRITNIQSTHSSSKSNFYFLLPIGWKKIKQMSYFNLHFTDYCQDEYIFLSLLASFFFFSFDTHAFLSCASFCTGLSFSY